MDYLKRRLFSLFSAFFLFLVIQLPLLAQKDTESSLLSTKVSLHYANVTIGKLLTELGQQYQLNFSYVNERLPLARRVSIQVQEKPLRTALELMFARTNIVYFVLEDQIVLTSKETTDSVGIAPSAQVEVIDSIALSNGIASQKGAGLTYRKVAIRPLKDYGSQKKQEFIFYFVREKKLFIRQEKPRKAPDLQLSLSSDSLTVPPDSTERAWPDSVTHTIQKRQSLLPNPKEEPEKPDYLKSRFYLAALLIPMPELMTWQLKSNNAVAVSDLSNRNTYSNRDGGVSTGLSVHYRLAKRFSVGTGVYYLFLSKSGTHTELLINRSYPDLTIRQTSDYAYNYSYFSFPLIVSYAVKSGRFGIDVYTGVSTNLFLNSNAPEEYPVYITQYFTNSDPNSTSDAAGNTYFSADNQPIVRQPVNFRRSIGSFNFGLHFNYAIGRKTALYFSPSWKFFTNSIYDEVAPIREQTSLFGLAIGFKRYL